MSDLKQLSLFSLSPQADGYRQKLRHFLAGDLRFHNESSTYASHDFHAFPAKFPPQLPRWFIEGLTQPGDRVLDPMMGSGTTVLESVLAGRHGIGFDIDPLALRLCKAKTLAVDEDVARAAGIAVTEQAQSALEGEHGALEQWIAQHFDPPTREFVGYWFSPTTQLELAALMRAIEALPDPDVREFLELAFSAIIITKSGGVTLARDLAHTRPHRVLDKPHRPAVPEFRKRVERNVRRLVHLAAVPGKASLHVGNAEAMPLATGSVDLIVTSPPYTSNAIDYMRAHKFSLVWFGYSLIELSALRSRYIGGEATSRFAFALLPDLPSRLVREIGNIDRKKGLALHRYYSEMTRVLTECYRVLKPGKAAIVVVGSSTMRNIDTQTPACLGEIGQALGFDLVGIAHRSLDRDRRMLPARSDGRRASPIEQRMHEEHVVAFCKPASLPGAIQSPTSNL